MTNYWGEVRGGAAVEYPSSDSERPSAARRRPGRRCDGPLDALVGARAAAALRPGGGIALRPRQVLLKLMEGVRAG